MIAIDYIDLVLIDITNNSQFNQIILDTYRAER